MKEPFKLLCSSFVASAAATATAADPFLQGDVLKIAFLPNFWPNFVDEPDREKKKKTHMVLSDDGGGGGDASHVLLWNSYMPELSCRARVQTC